MNPKFTQSVSARRPPISVAATFAVPGEEDEDVPTWIGDYVSQYVDVDPDTLPNLSKQLKIAQPAAYKGQDSTDAFEEWLVSVLRWLRFSRVTGDAFDEERVHLLGLVLEGPAIEWYNQEVSSPYRVEDQWRFLDVVLALHARFVHQATAQEATEQYEAVKFSRSAGVAAYYGERRKWAARMVQHLDAYAFRRSFLMGLPADIVRPMLESKGMSAERTPIEKLLRGALQVENSQKFISGYNRHSKPAVAAAAHSTTHMPSAPRPGNRGQRGPSGSAPRPFDTRATTTAPRAAPTGGAGASVSAAFAARGGTAPTRSSGGDKGKVVDKSRVQCFACRGMGHYATESVCPKFKSPALRIMETTNDNADDAPELATATPAAEDGEHTPQEPEGQAMGGLQYDSDGEHPMDEYEDFEYGEDVSNGEEPYFGAMRLTPFIDELVSENDIADALARLHDDAAVDDPMDNEVVDDMPPLEPIPASRDRLLPGILLRTPTDADWDLQNVDPR